MEPLTASDGFALMMIVIMVLAFGIIGSLLFCIRSSAARRDPDVDDLLDEVSDDEKGENQVAAEDTPSDQPWERDGDWWKK